MIKKIKSCLSVKVFFLTALLMAACSFMTYCCIFHFTPYLYKYDISDMEEIAYELSLELSGSSGDSETNASYFELFADILSENYDEEYRLHVFTGSGEEAALPDLDHLTGKRMEDFSSYEKTNSYCVTFDDKSEPYAVLIAQNRDKRSQLTESLHQILPILSIVIFFVSVLAAFFYTWYITAPVKKVSTISRQIAAMDFPVRCSSKRTDEIGVLSDSLNILSQKLTAALSKLQEANKKLQSEIDAERQLEQQRIEFFSAASHELKTPITIMKGQLQGMLYQIGRYKDRETYLAQSLDAVDTLERMVWQLLTISRFDTPGYTCKKQHLNLGDLINNCLSSHEDLFVQKDFTVEKFIDPDAYISGDRQLLQRVLDNLLGNAAAYSPAGSDLSVKLWRESEKIYLTVENTGIHIPDKDIPKLFEAFYRVDPSRNRQTGGTGLGLYIVKTILDLHESAVEIANTVRGVIVSIQFQESFHGGGSS